MVELDERFGRRTGDAQIAELEEVHVRGRVQQAQSSVDLKRIQVAATIEANRKHDLVDIPGANKFLGLIDGR
jgi:hypothetical protein